MKLCHSCYLCVHSIRSVPLSIVIPTGSILHVIQSLQGCEGSVRFEVLTTVKVTVLSSGL